MREFFEKLKNLKSYKRLLSLGTAVMLMHTPVMGQAESAEENTYAEFGLVQ